MPLQDLNRNIYNNDENVERRVHQKDEFSPFGQHSKGPSPFEGEQQWQKPNKGMTVKQKKILLFIAGVIVFILLAIGGYAYYQVYKRDAFHQDRVEVYFDGPKEADSTQVQQYFLHYKNNNKVTLKGAEIFLDYSENFQPADNVNLKYLSPNSSKFWIGDIKPGMEGSTELKGIFYAPKDAPVYLHASMQYVPSNGTAQLKTENQIGITITTSPVILELVAPQQVVDGDSVEYVIDYKNVDTRTLKDIQIRMEYPDGFEFTKAQPDPSEQKNIWYLGNIEPNQGAKIRVQGKIHGNIGQGKNVKVMLGHLGNNLQFAIYNQRELNSKLVTPLLTITQSLEGLTGDIVSAGDNLKYLIKFQNSGDIGLRDAIVTAEIKSDILDYTKLKLDRGSFDVSRSLITWKASDIPQLANLEPKAEGQIRFSIPVKSMIPVNKKEDKNFIISSIAKIDSPDIPTPIGSNKIIGSNVLDLKVATKTFFESSGFFYDSVLKNEGTLPMEVGKPTTFTIHWSITNISNDISGVVVSSSLPTGAHWVKKVLPENEKITFNERTNSLIWEPSFVSAGTGILAPKREVVFQIGVIPQPNQMGISLPLLNEAIMKAKDEFTGKEIELKTGPKTTELREDTKMTFLETQVKKN